MGIKSIKTYVWAALAVAAASTALVPTWFSRAQNLFVSHAPAPPPFMTDDEDWGKPAHPTAKPLEIFGAYSAGCLRGADTIALDGRGFHLVHASRNRYYGHPDLIHFIEVLGMESQSLQAGDLLVADMGQPRGGPMRTGHKSHQIGLDVDIWYRFLEVNTPPLSAHERENLYTRSLLRPDGKGVDPNLWSVKYERVLIAAASQPEVARIFINPHIKKLLCKLYPGPESVSWHRRLRPWYGHDDHFHTRLNCPAGSPKCEPQAEMGPDNGCGAELASWFNSDGTVINPPDSPPGPTPKLALPAECRQVLNETDA